ncbi:MAG: thiol-disulfide isomerase [Gemmatimonadetes bacterium]|nr:thiol-disulfide isomerase [Gemmatimonadota bacterium]
MARRLVAVAGVAGALLFLVEVRAQGPTVSRDGREVTFSRDVAPILYENCVSCHRPGEIAPMSLVTYQQARPWARSIRQEVLQRRMPPWKADPHYGTFRNDRLLTDQQIATLVAWADGGATEGDPADLPPAPRFAEGWQIGTPDLILTMAEPFAIPATGTVPWVNLPSSEYVVPEDTWVQAIEVRPGNRAVVHHAVAGAIAPGDNPNLGAENLHLYSPGLGAMIWREGYGKLLRKGTRIQFGMHYNTVGKATTDQTKVGFKFARKPVHTQVHTTILANTALAIPPMVRRHQAVTVFQFPADARLHGLRPHMHLRGKTGTASLIYPEGLRRVLLHVPDWDDSWQNYYVLGEPAPAPKGALLEFMANYDNSPANPLNPDPRSPVLWGQQVWEEMHSIYVTWTEVNDQNAGDGAPIQVPADKAFTTGVLGLE